MVATVIHHIVAEQADAALIVAPCGGDVATIDWRRSEGSDGPKLFGSMVTTASVRPTPARWRFGFHFGVRGRSSNALGCGLPIGTAGSLPGE